MRPKSLPSVVDVFSRSMSNEGMEPYQKSTQPARTRISPRCTVRTPPKYTFSESSGIELCAGNLYITLRYSNAACRSVKVRAIVFLAFPSFLDGHGTTYNHGTIFVRTTPESPPIELSKGYPDVTPSGTSMELLPFKVEGVVSPKMT